MELEFHEAANIFPLNEADVDAIAADIKANGQRLAIELLNGKIIDGRTRYKACVKIGFAPKTIDLDCVPNDDPVAYVWSLNIHRRHLTEGQKGAIMAKGLEIQKRAAKERMQTRKGNQPGASSDPGHTLSDFGRASEKAGEIAGISGRTVERAAKALRDGIPEVIKALEAGEIGAKTAARISALPPEEQRKEIAKPSASEPTLREEANPSPKTEPTYNEARSRGKGVQLAHEAIAVLKRIPLKDPLAMDGFTIVMNWIKHNKHSYGGSNV